MQIKCLSKGHFLNTFLTSLLHSRIKIQPLARWTQSLRLFLSVRARKGKEMANSSYLPSPCLFSFSGWHTSSWLLASRGSTWHWQLSFFTGRVFANNDIISIIMPAYIIPNDQSKMSNKRPPHPPAPQEKKKRERNWIRIFQISKC